MKIKKFSNSHYILVSKQNVELIESRAKTDLEDIEFLSEVDKKGNLHFIQKDK